MRASKYIGYLGIGLGLLIIIGAALLPVSPATQRFGPFKVDIRSDNCGPAAYVAVDKPDSDCGVAARRRLAFSSAVGLVVIAVGMAFYAGGDSADRSRIDVPTRRLRRRSLLRN